MSDAKKQIRQAFRDAVFERAQHRCEMCVAFGDWNFIGGDVLLDAHHITSRDHMPNGGYAASNGIALCPSCHTRAEQTYKAFFGDHVNSWPEYTPAKLYARIRSSHEQALKDSELLGA